MFKHNYLIHGLADGRKEVFYTARILSAGYTCAVVYWTGYPDQQRAVQGTYADMSKKIADEEENYMGLPFIGRFLKGKPYTATMRPRR